MSKRNKIILIVLAAIVVITSFIIMTIFIIDNRSDDPKILPKDDRITNEQFSSALRDCDNANDVTIKEECLTDNTGRIIKYDLDEYSIEKIDNKDSNSVIYYKNSKDIYYKYYFESPGWRRKEIDEAALDYIINLNISKYSDLYKSFTYEESESTYKLNEYDSYKSIEIKITDNKVRSYKYTLDNRDYQYTFTYYSNTTVDIPADYNIIYDKLNSNQWGELFNSSNNINNFTVSSVYDDKIGTESYDSSAIVSKVNNTEKHEEISRSKGVLSYYYKIKDSKLEKYKQDDLNWVLDNSIDYNNTKFSQKEELSIDVLVDNYDKIIFNEYANSYTLNNINHGNYNYSEITIMLEGEVVGYISMKYTYELDNILHNVTHVIDFYDFDKTKINITI